MPRWLQPTNVTAKLTVLVSTLVLGLFANAFAGYDEAYARLRSIEIHNNSSQTVRSIYATNGNIAVWSINLLGESAIPPGESKSIAPLIQSGSCEYNLKVVFDSKHELYWPRANLCFSTGWEISNSMLVRLVRPPRPKPPVVSKTSVKAKKRVANILIEAHRKIVRPKKQTSINIKSSRIFSGPTQYPPKDFAAYGIMAFRARASSQDRPRHLIICEAYMAALPHAVELLEFNIPRESQMATVWPITTDSHADVLNQHRQDNMCAAALDNYGLVAALQAFKEAEAAGAQLLGDGPFLLAWSPSIEKGNVNSPVLVADLSHVTTYPQALEIMTKWSQDIEQKPELWKKGWDIELVRRTIQYWADKNGTMILQLIGGKQ